jgi:hypothetical protein
MMVLSSAFGEEFDYFKGGADWTEACASVREL